MTEQSGVSLAAEDAAEKLVGFLARACAARWPATEPKDGTARVLSGDVLDSMALVELLAFIEREFGVALACTVDEIRRLETPAHLAREIVRRQQGAGAS